jgi:hypothetical protein
MKTNLTETKKTLPQFSFFQPPITTIIPSDNINIKEVYEKITQNRYLESAVERVRNARMPDIKRKIKTSTLAAITPSGIFNSREESGLINHSGYLCIDFDDIEEHRLPQLKNSLLSDTTIQTAMLFKSPGGNGYKWFIQIPPDKKTHGQYFDAVENYVQTTYGLEVDKKCRDVARACFLSSDKEAYLNTDDILSLDENFLNDWLLPRPMAKPTSSSERSLSETIRQVQSLVEVIQAQNIDITNEYDDWARVGFALCELGEKGRSFFHQISKISKKYDESEAENKYTSLLEKYDGETKLGTLFFIARKHNAIWNRQLPDTNLLLIGGQYIESKSQFILPDAQIMEAKPLFKIPDTPRTAIQRMMDAKNQKPIKQLVGSLWFTGELHILFGDNGNGKSLWATQIADALTKGKNVFTILPNENEPLRVLFYDFELSDKQFEKRYIDENGEPYVFSDNLHIDNIDFQSLVEKTPDIGIDDLIINKMEKDIENIIPDVLIIDNITYLKSQTTADANVALEIVRRLIQLKKRYNLSILILAHTPKTKNGTNITNNDLAGSKNLSNFADSISAIGQSNRRNEEKYIKQIKCRSGEILFDKSVITTTIRKVDNFLGFEYLECESESEHLKDYKKEELDGEREFKKGESIRLHKEGLSLRDIEGKVGVSKSTIGRWIKVYEENAA